VARVLGVVRLSRDTDESTSVERQRALIKGWADQNGHEVVGWAEDVDVSGSVAPWDRPSLSQWQSRAAEWDVMVAWRLDRITRRVLHLSALIEWCRENGKTLATTSEGFDISTGMGRAFVTILGVLAEGELDAVRERTSASFRHLMQVGRWRGGFVPYGYRPARSDDGAGWRLEVDPDTAGVLREIVRRIVDDGQAANAVVRWLNLSGVPTSLDAQRIRNGKAPTGTTWRVANLLRMLRSHTLLGFAEMTETVQLPTGKTEKVTRLVRGADGMPLERAEPLISQAEFAKLQAVLVSNGTKRSGNRQGGALLLRVAFCECGRPMYRNHGRSSWYYRCASAAETSVKCGNPTILAEQVETATVDAFLEMVGDTEMVQRVLVPGEDHAAQLVEVQRSIAQLMEDRSDGLYASKSGSAAFKAMLMKLEAQAETLEAMPSRDDEWLEEPTGQTYRQRWEGLTTTQERNKELRDSGMRVMVYRDPIRTEPLVDVGERVDLVGGRIAVLIKEWPAVKNSTP
jgi:DNA invertase Pin-like site-specific DNA recombinase